MNPLIIITGSNRGIGLEISRQLTHHFNNTSLLMTARSGDPTSKLIETAKNNSNSLFYHQLDVTKPDSIQQFANNLKNKWETSFSNINRLVLVNNAGIYHQKWTEEDFNNTLQTNLYGPIELTEHLLPLLLKSQIKDARVISVSSGFGKLENLSKSYRAKLDRVRDDFEKLTRSNPKSSEDLHLRELRELFRTHVTFDPKDPFGQEYVASYKISKVSLNLFTRLAAQEARRSLPEHNISFVSVDPGWVQTDMGGSNAPTPIEQGADTLVWASTIEKLPSDQFLYKRKPTDW